MAIVVAIEQDYDPPTGYAQAFRVKHVYSHDTLTGPTARHLLVRCFNAAAVAERVHRVVKRPAVRFITGVGHGSYSRFIGQDGQAIWDAATIPVVHVRGRIIHLLSCQTGGMLGLAAVQKGAAAFWGYTADFAFPIPSDTTLTDPVGDAFLGLDATIDRGILAGRGADEIYGAVKAYFWTVYAQLLAEGSPWAAIFLDDFVHLVCPAVTWGDPAARLD